LQQQQRQQQGANSGVAATPHRLGIEDEDELQETDQRRQLAKHFQINQFIYGSCFIFTSRVSYHIYYFKKIIPSGIHTFSYARNIYLTL